METAGQRALRLATNVNWYIFGAVLLCVGMFVITALGVWAWIGFVASFAYGMGCAAVLGARAIVSREDQGKVEHDI